MSRWTVLLVCGPLAALGIAAMVSGTTRIAHSRRELTELAATSAFEGRAFAETLKGAHAERQLEALDKRRAIARDLAAARRDRVLGAVLVALSFVLGLGVRALARMADEIEVERQSLHERTGKIDWKGP